MADKLFEILKNEELNKVAVACAATADCPLPVKDADCELCRDKEVAQAEQKHTLKQVIDRLDKLLQLVSHTQGNGFRRDIGRFVAELEKEGKDD